MANDRMRIVCRHCGADYYMAKGYFGDYYTLADRTPESAVLFVNRWNEFLGKHGSNCDKAVTMVDNAREHFILFGEIEEWDEQTHTITNVWNDKDMKPNGYIKMPEDF